MNKITYHKEGDYLIPNLAIKGTKDVSIILTIEQKKLYLKSCFIVK